VTAAGIVSMTGSSLRNAPNAAPSAAIGSPVKASLMPKASASDWRPSAQKAGFSLLRLLPSVSTYIFPIIFK
jgi:hypothetical protein